jgi:intein/homing endonuclease
MAPRRAGPPTAGIALAAMAAGAPEAGAAAAAPSGTGSVSQSMADVQVEIIPRVSTGLPILDWVLNGGLKNGGGLLLGGQPGAGKCLTADARVLDPSTGDWLPVTAWRERLRPVVATDPATLRQAPAPTAAFFAQGRKPVVRVATGLGRELECTDDHPLLTPHGWRPAGSLRRGDRIAAPRALPYFGRDAMPEHEVRLLAYVLADGYTGGGCAQVTSSKPSVIRGLRAIAEALGDDLRCYARGGRPGGDFRFAKRGAAKNGRPSGAMRVVEREGLRGARAADKFVPAPIFRLPRERLRTFLRCLLTCDGSVCVAGGAAQFVYATTSRRLAADVQHLLLRFGLVARLRARHSVVSGEPYVSYAVEMSGTHDVRRLLEQVGIDDRGEAVRAIDALPEPSTPSTRRDTVPTGDVFWEELHRARGATPVATLGRLAGVTLQDRRRDRPLARSTVAALADQLPGSAALGALGHGDVYWDEIASVEPAGEREVFDVSVPGPANFVANDIVVHNSTLLMQVAAESGFPSVLYASGEESESQIKERAVRLRLGDRGHVRLLSYQPMEVIWREAHECDARLVIVDSIQTIVTERFNKPHGHHGQMKYVINKLCKGLKDEGRSMLIIGQVNKDGDFEGPKSLEHIVDGVAFLSGARNQPIKNVSLFKHRFGPADRQARLRMTETGFVEVEPDEKGQDKHGGAESSRVPDLVDEFAGTAAGYGRS